MLATDLLMDEHTQIEQVLDALDTYATRLGTSAVPEDLARFVAFVRGFADVVHHGKEERILFRAMVALGYRADAGPVAVFQQEHARGRMLVTMLADAAARAPAWSAEDMERIRQTARDYVVLLRRHIQKEDSVLFPLAEMTFGPDRLEQMSTEFDAADAQHRDSGLLDHTLSLARDLVAGYPAPAPSERYRGTATHDACHELCDRFDCVYSAVEEELAPWAHHA